MSTRGTRLMHGSLFQFTCDSCWTGFSARTWTRDQAEAEARSKGWSIGTYHYCRECR